MGTVGKRLSRDEPLTEHDVAERIDRAAFRALRLLTAARNLGLRDDVLASRYLAAGLLPALAAELDEWNQPTGDTP